MNFFCLNRRKLFVDQNFRRAYIKKKNLLKIFFFEYFNTFSKKRAFSFLFFRSKCLKPRRKNFFFLTKLRTRAFKSFLRPFFLKRSLTPHPKKNSFKISFLKRHRRSFASFCLKNRGEKRTRLALQEKENLGENSPPHRFKKSIKFRS